MSQTLAADETKLAPPVRTRKGTFEGFLSDDVIRSRVVLEILSTERDYVKNLEDVVEVSWRESFNCVVTSHYHRPAKRTYNRFGCSWSELEKATEKNNFSASKKHGCDPYMLVTQGITHDYQFVDVSRKGGGKEFSTQRETSNYLGYLDLY